MSRSPLRNSSRLFDSVSNAYIPQLIGYIPAIGVGPCQIIAAPIIEHSLLLKCGFWHEIAFVRGVFSYSLRVGRR